MPPTILPRTGLRVGFTDGIDNYTNTDVTAVANKIEQHDARIEEVDAFSQTLTTTTATVVGFTGGTLRAANGSLTKKTAFTYTPPTASSGTLTTYVEIDSAGVVTGNAVGFSADKKPLATVVTNTTNIVSVDDSVRVGFDFAAGGASAVADASVTVKGAVKLATAPAVANDPIAAGTNDPRLSDARTPLAHSHAIADTTGLQATLDGKSASTHVHTDLLKRDGTNAMTATLGMGGFKIVNGATPTAPTDFVIKSYADALAQGNRDLLAVKAATTANITLSGAQTIDAVSVLAGDRVLVKDQTTQSANGIYIVAAGAWTRSTDADTAGELPSGTRVFVANGSINLNTSWTMISTLTTLGTDPMTWTQSNASNSGTGTTPQTIGTGIGTFKTRTGVVDEFRSVAAASDKVAVTEVGDTINIDVVEANLDLAELRGTLSVTKGGTGLTSTVTGDLIIAAAANSLARLAGNTTSTRRFLTSTGDGTNATAPAYNAIRGIDLPVFGASGTNHAAGAVPDPGAVTGTSRVLHEDGTWKSVTGASSTTFVTLTDAPASYTGAGGHLVRVNDAATGLDFIAPPPLRIPQSVTGLTATYFTDTTFTTFEQTVIEQAFNFLENSGQAVVNARFARANFSMRGKAYFKPLYTENYTFTLSADDSADIYINGNFKRSGGGTFSMQLTAGRTYEILVDYVNTSFAVAQLKVEWSSTSQALQVLPTFTEPLSASGLTTENVQDLVAAMFGTSGVYDDSAGTYTITVPPGTTAEDIDDRVNALIQAGANVTKTYDDAGNVLTLAASGGGSGGTMAVLNLTGYTSPITLTEAQTEAKTLRIEGTHPSGVPEIIYPRATLQEVLHSTTGGGGVSAVNTALGKAALRDGVTSVTALTDGATAYIGGSAEMNSVTAGYFVVDMGAVVSVAGVAVFRSAATGSTTQNITVETGTTSLTSGFTAVGNMSSTQETKSDYTFPAPVMARYIVFRKPVPSDGNGLAVNELYVYESIPANVRMKGSSGDTGVLVPQNSNMPIVANAITAREILSSAPNDLIHYAPGKPTAGEVLMRVPILRPYTLDFKDAVFALDIAATNAYTVEWRHGATLLNSALVNAGGVTGTYANANIFTLTSGWLTVVAPATVDPTASGVAFGVKGSN